MRAKVSYAFDIHHYVHDNQIEEFEEQIEEWQRERQAPMLIGAGSASYSGYRLVVFSFEREDEAALFRLFFGGSLKPTFEPTLSIPVG